MRASITAEATISDAARISLRGKFITFEGGEGTGKSTHVARLAKRLRASGLKVVTTREPGGSPGAEIIRHVLMSGAAEAFGPELEAILFSAARSDHIDQTIAPALAAGKWVISDRFTDSTRVYQGIGGNVPADFISRLERIAVGDIRPDLTIILDVPAEDGLARAAARRGEDDADRFEREAIDIHRRLRDGFLAIAEAEPDRCVVIDATASVKTVADRIWAAVEERLLVEA